MAMDLCGIPAAAAPSGQTSNFVNPTSLAPVAIAVSTITTTFAVVLTTGRLWANIRKLNWAHCMP